jgi:hypothetical protein
MADDIRARRAERARQEKLKGMPKQMARYAVVVAVIALVVVGIAYAATHQPPAKRLVHEHAAFQWYIEGQPISFRSGDYDCNLAHLCDLVHMHFNPANPETDETDVLHIEGYYPGGTPDWNLAKIFGQYGMTIQPTNIQLDTKGGHNGTDWRNTGNLTWAAYVSAATLDRRGAFEPVPGDWTQHVPRDREKLLLTYGPHDPAELQREEQSIPDAQVWGGGGAPMP